MPCRLNTTTPPSPLNQNQTLLLFVWLPRFVFFNTFPSLIDPKLEQGRFLCSSSCRHRVQSANLKQHQTCYLYFSTRTMSALKHSWIRPNDTSFQDLVGWGLWQDIGKKYEMAGKMQEARWAETCVKRGTWVAGVAWEWCGRYSKVLKPEKRERFQAKTFLGPIIFIKISITAICLYIGLRR